jgi:hypothetical protein
VHYETAGKITYPVPCDQIVQRVDRIVDGPVIGPEELEILVGEGWPTMVRLSQDSEPWVANRDSPALDIRFVPLIPLQKPGGKPGKPQWFLKPRL